MYYLKHKFTIKILNLRFDKMTKDSIFSENFYFGSVCAGNPLEIQETTFNLCKTFNSSSDLKVIVLAFDILINLNKNIMAMIAEGFDSVLGRKPFRCKT